MVGLQGRPLMKKNCRSVVVLPQPRENFEINPTTRTRLLPGDDLQGWSTSIQIYPRDVNRTYVVMSCAARRRRTAFSVSTSKSRSSPTMFSSALGPHKAETEAFSEGVPSVRRETVFRLFGNASSLSERDNGRPFLTFHPGLTL